MEYLLRLYEARPNVKRASMLVSGYFMKYIITEDMRYAREAAAFLDNILTKYSDMQLMLFSVYFNIILGDSERVEDELSYFGYYKKHIKANMPDIYAVYVFLKALEEGMNGLKSSCLEYAEELRSLKSDTGCFTAYIYMQIRSNKTDIEKYIYESKNKTSIFYYAVLYLFLVKRGTQLQDKQVLSMFVKWAANHNIDISEVLENNKQSIAIGIFDGELAYRLYNKYKSDFLLSQLCRISMLNFDYDIKAYEIYSEAVRRQLETEGLINAFVHSSYKCGKEEMNVYCINEYLSGNDDNSDIKAYIYYMIISCGKFDELYQKYSQDIVRFTELSLEKHLESEGNGRYYYGLYCHYYINNFRQDSIYNKMIENIIPSRLFMYEVNVKNAGYIWIREKFCSKIKKYKTEDSKALICSADNEFIYYLFDENSKEIISEKAEITRLVPNVSVKLVYMFYLRGIYNDDSLYCLSEYISQRYEGTFCDILEKTLETQNCSSEFKLQIYSALGRIYFESDEYEKAAYYYKKLKHIGDDEIQNAVEAFIKTGNIKKAVEICSSQSFKISDRVLFYVARASYGEYERELVNVYYELLMKSYYDIRFVKSVIKWYNGCIDDWIELRGLLKSKNVFEKDIDELIISQCINMRIFNEAAEEIFADMYENERENQLTESFIDFCCYEIITQNEEISYRLLGCLEDYALKNHSLEVLAALGYLYCEKKIKSENSDYIIPIIIEETSKRNISFPWLNKYGRKRAFIHTDLPERDVYFCYKMQDMEDIIKIKADYFRYGIYTVQIPVFCGDKIEYYFMSCTEGGSTQTQTKIQVCARDNIISEADTFDKVNNALIYRQTMRNMSAERIIKEIESDIILKCSIT